MITGTIKMMMIIDIIFDDYEYNFGVIHVDSNDDYDDGHFYRFMRCIRLSP